MLELEQLLLKLVQMEAGDVAGGPLRAGELQQSFPAQFVFLAVEQFRRSVGVEQQRVPRVPKPW